MPTNSYSREHDRTSRSTSSIAVRGRDEETPIFLGDPLRPDNRQLLLERQLRIFKNGPRQGIGPEVADEEIVRAMMVVRANTMVYEAATPEMTQMLLDLLNNYISPVVQSRGSAGEGDLPMMGNVEGTMVGAGQAYLRGQRMPARQALAQAGLQPLVPFAADDAAIVSTNAYSAGQAALLLYDSKRMQDWSDLTFSMSMLGLNSSVTPITQVPQRARPFPYQNKLARRLLELIRGSYLFEFETPPGFNRRRIIQDPLSFRDYSQRNGALWEAYARLKKNILIQINSSDHNPAVVPGSKPSDSWELDTPWLRRYFVEEGEAGVSGFDPVERQLRCPAFGATISRRTRIALANAIAAHVQRVLRFPDTFFTVVAPADVLSADELALAPPQGASYTISDLMAEIQTLAKCGCRTGQRAGPQRGGHGDLHAPAGGQGTARGRQRPAAGRAGDALVELLDGGPPEAEPGALVWGRPGQHAGGAASSASRGSRPPTCGPSCRPVSWSTR